MQVAPRDAKPPQRDQIRAMWSVYGPESREENDELANILIARRDNVAKAYGIKNNQDAAAEQRRPS